MYAQRRRIAKINSNLIMYSVKKHSRRTSQLRNVRGGVGGEDGKTERNANEREGGEGGKKRVPYLAG